MGVVLTRRPAGWPARWLAVVGRQWSTVQATAASQNTGPPASLTLSAWCPGGTPSLRRGWARLFLVAVGEAAVGSREGERLAARQTEWRPRWWIRGLPGLTCLVQRLGSVTEETAKAEPRRHEHTRPLLTITQAHTQIKGPNKKWSKCHIKSRLQRKSRLNPKNGFILLNLDHFSVVLFKNGLSSLFVWTFQILFISANKNRPIEKLYYFICTLCETKFNTTFMSVYYDFRR